MKKNIGLVWGSWEPHAFSGSESANFLKNIDELKIKDITLIPTYFFDNDKEGIRYRDWNNTPDTNRQKDIIIELLNRGISLNYRPHIDPSGFASNYEHKEGKQGSLPWRGLFKNFNPMDKNLHYIDILLNSLSILNNVFKSNLLNEVDIEPIRLDIGAELMESIKKFPSSWLDLLNLVKKEIETNYPILKNRVIFGHNFCHHIEYLKRLDNHTDYFLRMLSDGDEKSNSNLLFVDDMSKENRQELAEYIKNLDMFSISQYMPLDTHKDISDSLMMHENNFIKEILGVELGIDESDLPPFLIGEFGIGILGLSAPNVWNDKEWESASRGNLILKPVEQKYQSKKAIEGMIKYLNSPDSKANSCQLWISGEPYNVLGSPITSELLTQYWNSF